VDIVKTRNHAAVKNLSAAAMESDEQNNLKLSMQTRHLSVEVPWASAILRANMARSDENRYRPRRSAAAVEVVRIGHREQTEGVPPRAQKNPTAVPGAMPELMKR